MFFNFVLTMFLPQFNFQEDTFLRIGHKVPKTCSCENFLHKTSYKRESKRGRVGEGEGATILVTFLINIFYLVYYANIQPSWSKTKLEYLNIKVRLLIWEILSGLVNQEKLSKSKCLIVFVVFSFFVTKRTQSNSEKHPFDQHYSY